jgi:GNAT superfamily N-acetyltransferase
MTPTDLTGMMDATWPAVAVSRCGGFRLRQGGGGGRRVSAATADGPFTDEGLSQAEAAMRATGGPPLFRVHLEETALDAALEARGYAVVNPTLMVRLDLPLPAPAPGTVYAHWPPLAIQAELWAAGGTGPARLAVMDRALGPRTSLLARLGQRPAGTAFAAMGPGGAMLHALEVAPPARRHGIGSALIRAAARWAARHGAGSLLLLVEAGNTASLALCRSLGGSAAPAYHYRLGTGAD